MIIEENGHIELSTISDENMPQELTDLFGQNASRKENKITLDLQDFLDKNGNPYLKAPAQATPAQAATAWIAWLHHTNKEETDSNDSPIQDNTQAIVSQDNFTPKTYETREGESQIRNNFDFAIYTIDTSGFDPDNVV